MQPDRDASIDPQELRAQIAAERQRYIQQRLSGSEVTASFFSSSSTVLARTSVPVQAHVLDDAGQSPSIFIEGEVPSVEELRTQIQREREAYIGRQLAANPSAAEGLMQEAAGREAALS
jgi:hypothetical protein